jgi:DNA-binding NtrC family response regulator
VPKNKQFQADHHMTAPLPTLLCVDDEQYVLTSLLRLFKHDYDVMVAMSGAEALDIVRSRRINVLVSDQRMPGMTGVDLLRQVGELSPSTMRILLTGYSDLNATIDSVNKGEVFRFITKPWKNDVLRFSVQLAARASLASLGEMTVPLPTSGQVTAPTDILVIDPDFAFYSSVEQLCRGTIRTFHATSVEDALDILEICPDVGVIISEVRIGQQDVTELLKVLKAEHPSIATVVASGFADANLIIKLINEGQIVRFVSKPVDLERLYGAITRAVGMHKLLRGSSVLVERYRVEGAAANTNANTAPASPSALPPTAQDFEKTQPLKIIEDVPANYAAVSANTAANPATRQKFPEPMIQAEYAPPSLLSRVRALFGGKR